MGMEKYFQCFLLNSIYYKGRVSTKEWGGVENIPLCFPTIFKVVVAIKLKPSR